MADAAAHPFDVDATRRALLERGGGYEVVHSSPGLEIGVYVLVAQYPASDVEYRPHFRLGQMPTREERNER